MKTKRIISLLLASLLTSASACGSEAPEKDNGTDTTAEETTISRMSTDSNSTNPGGIRTCGIPASSARTGRSISR